MGYDERYDSPAIRTQANRVPYHIGEEILRLNPVRRIALDVGCGTCRKLFEAAPYFQTYHAIDNNPFMIRAAQKHVRETGLHNIHPLEGSAFYLPFKNNSIHFVSCMLAPFSITEMHRVLKKGGILFMEMLGANDKRALKKAFGKDELGWRGILLNQHVRLREDYFRSLLAVYFENITIRHFYWYTEISRKGLNTLLELTPTIRHFNARRDRAILKTLFEGKEKIRFREHRMLITAIRN